jgi:hypothetical protein
VTVEWAHLEKLMTVGDFTGIADALRDLTVAERKALVAPLTAFERADRRAPADHAVKFGHHGVFTLTAVGVLPTAAALAPWINRYRWWAAVEVPGEGWYRPDAMALAFDLLRARQVPWSGDLACRVAQARQLSPDNVRLIEGLADDAGIELPVTDSLARAWAQANRFAVPGEIQPKWDRLLVRLFDTVDAGRLLVVAADYGLGRAVATFVAEGRLGRVDIIDRCVGALQRGGRLGDVRGHLAVYEALELGLPEVVARLRDYLPLLADGHSTVAGMAQRELFRADDAGQLDVGLFLDASRAVFLRSEKKLVRAQLDRLRMVLDRDPGSVDEAMPVLATIFQHTAPDLRRLAVDLAVAYGPKASDQAQAELTAAAGELPPDYRLTLSAVLGVTTETTPAPVFTAAPPVPVRTAFPPPIETPGELATEAAALLVPARRNVTVDPVRFERVLAGLVALSCRDRTALRGVTPMAKGTLTVQNGDALDWDHWGDWKSEFTELRLAMFAAGLPTSATVATPFPEPATFTGDWHWREKLDQLYGRSSRWRGERQGMLRLRLREISIGVVHAPRPMLVATPTGSTGLLDPEVLLERLTTAAQGGWEPWPHDLTQALLRLPATGDDAVVSRASALGTAAGARLADWLTGDSHDQIVELLPALRGHGGFGFGYLWHLKPCWSMVLPAHRDLVADVAVDGLFGDGGGDRLMRALAEADGPVGPSVVTALAVGCGAARPGDRQATVDALLVLAARGQLNSTMLGLHAAELALTTGWVPLNHMVTCLRDLAGAGAAIHAWDVLAAMVPPLLNPKAGRPKQGLADFLALGVELAQQLRPKMDIMYLAEVAGRRSSSRMVVEARRLLTALRQSDSDSTGAG